MERFGRVFLEVGSIEGAGMIDGMCRDRRREVAGD